MNNPNPLIPQGSLLEQQAKGKPHLRIALFIVAVHVVFLGLLLMQGCKRDSDSLELADAETNDFGFTSPNRQTIFSTNMLPELEIPPAQDPDTGATGFTQSYVEPDPVPPVAEVQQPAPSSAGPATPEPAPAPAVVTRQHEVVAGDTFFTLAKKYNVSAAEIAAANPNVDPLRLRVKQKLIIPPPSPAVAAPATAEKLPPGVEIYQVRSGDNLTQIAKTHGTTVTAIRQLNGMSTDRIYIGQKLKIPAKTNGATLGTP